MTYFNYIFILSLRKMNFYPPFSWTRPFIPDSLKFRHSKMSLSHVSIMGAFKSGSDIVVLKQFFKIFNLLNYIKLHQIVRISEQLTYGSIVGLSCKMIHCTMVKQGKYFLLLANMAYYTTDSLLYWPNNYVLMYYVII